MTKTGLSEINGERLASTLAATPSRDRDSISGLGKELLDLTQIEFGLDVRDGGTDSMRWELLQAWR